MARASRQTPCGFAIFAEDVREEVGRKFGLLGIPMAQVALPQFPAAVRLALLVQYFEHVGESDEPVTLVIHVPGTEGPAIQTPMDTNVLRAPRAADEVDPNDPVVGLVMTTLVVLVLPEPGYVEVTAVRGDTEIKLARQKFVLAEGAAPNLDTPPPS